MASSRGIKLWERPGVWEDRHPERAARTCQRGGGDPDARGPVGMGVSTWLLSPQCRQHLRGLGRPNGIHWVWCEALWVACFPTLHRLNTIGESVGVAEGPGRKGPWQPRQVDQGKAKLVRVGGSGPAWPWCLTQDGQRLSLHELECVKTSQAHGEEGRTLVLGGLG